MHDISLVMAENEKNILENIGEQEYKYGFTTDIETETIGKGLSEEVVRLISAKKGEPEWMTERRVAAYRHWLTLEPPTWAHLTIPPIDFHRRDREGHRIAGSRVAVARAAEIGDADRIRRNRGPGDLRHLERKVAGRGVCAASCGGCQERRGCANRHLSEVHKRGGFIRIRKIFAISGIQKYTAPAYRTGIF